MTFSLPAALGWIDRELPQLVMPDPPGSFAECVLPLADLARAGDLLIDAGHADAGRRYLEHAWRQLQDGEFLRTLVASAPHNVVASFVYVPFYRHGLRNDALEQALVERAAQPGVPPLHRLTIAATLEAIGRPSPWPLGAQLANDWARRLSLPWSLNEVELTTIAHDIYFVSDYGRARDRLPAAQREVLAKWLPVWAVELAKKQLVELVALMVLAWQCSLDGRAPPEAWRCLDDAQAADGSLPQPERRRHLRATLVAVMAASDRARP